MSWLCFICAGRDILSTITFFFNLICVYYISLFLLAWARTLWLVLEDFVRHSGKLLSANGSGITIFCHLDSARGVCSGTWDMICFIEHLCISDMLKLMMVLLIAYLSECSALDPSLSATPYSITVHINYSFGIPTSFNIPRKPWLTEENRARPSMMWSS